MVPTVIKFAGGEENFILVQEDVNTVHDKLLSEAGVPFALTQLDGNTVWVNPRNVAYWFEGKEQRERGAGPVPRSLPR